jgi:hypothetical protein
MKATGGWIVVLVPILAAVTCHAPGADGAPEGTLTIWTDVRGGSGLSVSIDDRFAGSLVQFFVAGPPNCGDTAGTIVFRSRAGRHRIIAADSAHRIWKGYATVDAGHCALIKLAPPHAVTRHDTIVADSGG